MESPGDECSAPRQQSFKQALEQKRDDIKVIQFFRGLMKAIMIALLECVPAWEGNWTSDCLLAFGWQGAGEERLLVTANCAPNQTQCHVRLWWRVNTDNFWF